MAADEAVKRGVPDGADAAGGWGTVEKSGFPATLKRVPEQFNENA